MKRKTYKAIWMIMTVLALLFVTGCSNTTKQEVSEIQSSDQSNDEDTLSDTAEEVQKNDEDTLLSDTTEEVQKYDNLVFFDLDGTLLNDDSKVPEENMKAIKELQEKNILPIISTGRPPSDVEDLVDGAGIDSYIALNGQVIKVNGEFIYKDEISADLIERFVEFANEQGNAVLFQSDYTAAATKIDSNVEGLCEMDNVSLPEVDSEFYKTTPVYYLYLYVGEDEGKDDAYIEMFGEELSFTRDSPYTMAVITAGHSKGTGIEMAIEKLGQEGVSTYAFGDGNNDILMFEKVDTAIAMGNAKEILKENADYITSSNIEGGIVEGLRHYELID